MAPRTSLIVTAAGSGSRFLESLPSRSKAASSSKIFFELGGIPVLERTLKAFSSISAIAETWVTVPASELAEARRWGLSRGFKKVKWISGGKTRAESVYNALKKTSPRSAWVMVHDGARPLILPETVKKMLASASKYDGLVLARKVVPTLKRITDGNRIAGTVDRSQLAEAETPQIVKRTLLLAAYKNNSNAFTFTDESSLVEAAGGKMGVMFHAGWNPKLTHYADYELAEARIHFDSCNSGADGNEIRVGKGYDIHRLVEGRKLWVGGLRIPFEKGSLGHSDGDALLHAITDAVLGALGLGDIGDWFSDKDARYKNISSVKLLKQVLDHAFASGWRVEQADTNVVLERPKLGSLKKEIRAKIAGLLKLPVENVSVKGRTYEGLPPIGTGDAWAAEAIVMLRKVTV